MRALKGLGLLALALLGLCNVLGAKAAKQLTGLDLASFEGREVLVLRTSGDVPAPGTFSSDKTAGTLSFILRGVGADDAVTPRGGMSLVRSVSLDRANLDGVKVTITFTRPELADQHCFRFTQPSERLVLLEVFDQPESKSIADPISDPDKQLKIEPSADKRAADQPVATKPVAVNLDRTAQSGWNPDSLGLTTLDLSGSDAQQVLALAAATGLLNVKQRAYVATEGLGELSIDPAGQSLANWSGATPPGELYLSGSPDQIAQFLKLASAENVGRQPSLGQYWDSVQSKQPLRALSQPATTQPGSAPSTLRSRKVPQGDAYLGFGFTQELPGGARLSDVRVTLPATSGYNLYDVLNYLSEISGISIMIDPYAFSAPTGSSREALVPEAPQGSGNQPGFRPGAVFDPSSFRSGSVIGNLVNVPFDDALRLILETHELEYVVYGGAGGSAPAESAGPGGYEKPVIMVTSKERLEQELEGENEVELYQPHYADGFELGNILDELNMQPAGWYIYQGSGGGNGGNGGGGNGGNGGGGGRQPGGGGGNGGGGGGGRGRNSAGGSFLRDADSGAFFYRGSSREPIYQRLREAIDSGLPVIRIKLAPESGMLVTGFVLPE